MNKVVVLMATYNGDRFIGEQIECVLRQKNVDVTLIISDDSSSDNTLKIIHEYCNLHQNISLCNIQRVGGSAKNFYTLMSQINFREYDFVALSDQDDVWPDHKLSHAIDQITSHQADGYSSDVIVVNERMETIKCSKKSHLQKKYDFLFESPGPGCTFVITQTLYQFLKSKIDDRVFGFDYHDWWMYACARHHGFRWHIDDAPNIFYRQHTNNLIGANTGFISNIKRIKRVFTGGYNRDLIYLHKLINPGQHSFNIQQVLFYLLNFYHTRRSMFHCLMNILLLLVILIQKTLPNKRD